MELLLDDDLYEPRALGLRVWNGNRPEEDADDCFLDAAFLVGPADAAARSITSIRSRAGESED